MPRRQHCKLPSTSRVERIGRDEHGVGALLRDDRKRGVDFLRRAGFEDEQPPSERADTLLRRLLVEFTKMAMSVACGTSSLSTSRCLLPSSAENQLTPVTFAPGRLRLATSPALTGSRPLVKRIGMLDVSRLATSAVLLPPTAAMAATL